jgi:hypothetical protein
MAPRLSRPSGHQVLCIAQVVIKVDCEDSIVTVQVGRLRHDAAGRETWTWFVTVAPMLGEAIQRIVADNRRVLPKLLNPMRIVTFSVISKWST